MTAISKEQITETRELSPDELNQVTGGGQFFVPKFRADIYEGERCAKGYVPPLWGEVC